MSPISALLVLNGKVLIFILVTVEQFVNFMLASEKQPKLISIFILVSCQKVGGSDIEQKLILHELRFLSSFLGEYIA